jgi:SAM-dependent methyltransferase
MTTQPQTQREYWSGKVGGEWAAYADGIDIMLRSLTQTALEHAGFLPGQRVLDIGCGAGATSLDIARRVGANGAVLGVDLSPQLLAVARARAAEARLNAQFIEADAGSADLGAEPFDAAWSRFGVMFFEQPPQAFAHIRASLRPNGRLAFVCWRAMADNPWATIPIEAIKPLLKTPLAPPDPEAPGPYALADGAKIKRILTESGWRDIALTPWDGDLPVGGGGSLDDTAGFLLRIGPCARAIADQQLDAAEAKRRLVAQLTPHHRNNAVILPAACWFVTATA